MVKFAWPRRSAHGSLEFSMSIGGISDDGETWPKPRWRWKEEIEGLDDSGGDGRPAIRGVGSGLLSKDEASGSATPGECKGD